jgi:class 3 adenylate cyclase
VTSDNRPQLEFRVLGPLEIRSPRGVVSLGGGKPRALLADLLIHLGQVVSVDRLIDDLWGAAAPVTARHALEVHVSQLRKVLGPHGGPLVTRAPGYVFDVDPPHLDAFVFERLLGEARRSSDAAAARDAVGEALALWRGPALAEFTYEPFAQAEIARLEELKVQAVEQRIEADLELGRDLELVAELESLIAANPLRERLRGQLMIALYRAGRQADALAAYREARRTLVDDLGVDAGPELRALETAILRQDESLARPVAYEAVAAPKRRFLTILFVDLVDSTGLAQAVDAEVLQRVLQQYFDVASGVVARHGGTTEKFVGDALMAVFGAPLAHEDDALRAARAALEIVDAVRALGARLEPELGIDLDVRTGIATGEVLAGSSGKGDALVSGRAVMLAARLQQAAAPGAIAVDEATRSLIAHAARLDGLGDLSLRGIPEPVPAFRLAEVQPVAPAVARRLDAPLVGRSRELTVLRTAFARATEEPAVHVVSLLGPAGVGKSRIVRELVDELGGRASVLAGHCPSYGDGITYWPLREVLGSPEAIQTALAAELDGGSVAEQLTAALGGEAHGNVDQIPFAFRRFCESVAGHRPLVLVLDDLHWAEPPLLDLVEHLVDRSTGHAILVLCLARDDLLEVRPAFLARRARAERLVLEGLSDDEADALTGHLLAGTELPRETRDRITVTAEGNPLFLEQLLSYATEGGSGVPPTIQALLAARLDRLGPAERAVLECAAIVGREFDLADVRALLKPEAAPTAGRHLAKLEQRGFVLASAGGFRIGHALIQDAAYRSAPKTLRAELHERYGDQLARGAHPEAAMLDELVGYHLEQAYRLHAELGPDDRHGRRLAGDAGLRLGTAGIRACKRNDASAATNLLERATTLLPDDDGFRRVLLCELGVGLGATGNADRARQALDAALGAAIAAGDRGVELRARVELGARRVLTDPEGAAPLFLELAADSISALEALGDDRALGRTWMLTGWVHGGVHCRNAQWAEAAELARRHYRRAGWPSSACLGQLAAALYFGPTPAAVAISRCEALLDEAEDLAGEANVRAFLAGLEAMRGGFDKALELLGRARAVFEELGQMTEVGRLCGPLESAVHLLAGDTAAAERALRESCAIVSGLRDRSPLATQAAELAETLYRQGRIAEAEQCTHIAEDQAASDDVGAQFSWRSVRAKILALEGDAAEGETLAREAVVLAGQTDALNQRAKILLDLAEIVRRRGRLRDASSIAEQAVELYERKGNESAAAAARTEVVGTPA